MQNRNNLHGGKLNLKEKNEYGERKLTLKRFWRSHKVLQSSLSGVPLECGANVL